MLMSDLLFCGASAGWRRFAPFALTARGSLPVLGAAFWLSTTAVAAPLASESFEGDLTGPLSGQAGGGGWNGSWTAPGNVTRADVVDTTSSPMSFAVTGGGLVSGGSRALEVQLSGPAASQLCGARTLATPIAQTFYVGYLVRYHAGTGWSGNNTFTLHLSTSASATTTLNFGLRGGQFVIRSGTGTPVSGASTGGPVANGTDYYLVCLLNWSGSAFTNANLWLNPAADDDTATPNGDAVLNGLTQSVITHVFFRQAALEADDVLRADEIRIGTAWSDVVPPGGPTNPPPSGRWHGAQ